MSRLLYIQASPRGNDSFSMRTAEAFLEAYTQKNPDCAIDVLNLFGGDIPPFDVSRVDAKYALMRGETMKIPQHKAWKEVERIIDRFKKADMYLFAVPMWNFGIPNVLKLYLDHLVQPGYTFDPAAEKGQTGLLKDKSAFVAYARGGEYKIGDQGDPFDFQQSYMEAILGFIGIDKIDSVVVQSTLAQGPEVAEKRLHDALEKAADYGTKF